MNRIVLTGLAILFLLSNSIAQDFELVSLSAFGVYQKIKIKVDKETKFKVTASIKADIMDDSAWAGIYAGVIEHGESYGFYDSMSDRPVKTNTWETYEVEGILNTKSDTLQFGVQGFYTGKFYFDDVKLFIENENGSYENVMLINAGFEEPMKNNILPHWDQYHIDERIQKPRQIVVSTIKDGYDGKHVLEFDNSAVRPPTKIGEYEGATPKIATLITMLEDLRFRVISQVEDLDLNQTDYLLDDKANRIGALVMHLAAAEKYYQVYTFEGRSFNDEESAIWEQGLSLGDEARLNIKGKDIDYYLKIYGEVRDETIRLLKQKDDSWLDEGGNYFSWFHVMEHQSSHLGQILFLKKRLPPKTKHKN